MKYVSIDRALSHDYKMAKYWKERCLAAEKVLDSSPINITVAKERDSKEIKAWQKIVRSSPQK
jgi:hypothetical protein